MTGLLYRCLVWLHPPHFRREFGGEMLAIFEEASKTESPLALCSDAAVSLVRQWLLRTGSWKAVAAVMLASFQVILGGLGAAALRPSLHAEVSSKTPLAQQQITVPILVGLGVAVVFGLLLFTMGLNLWVKNCNARRRPVSLKVR